MNIIYSEKIEKGAYMSWLQCGDYSAIGSRQKGGK
jgi:hypothetical protein